MWLRGSHAQSIYITDGTPIGNYKRSSREIDLKQIIEFSAINKLLMTVDGKLHPCCDKAKLIPQLENQFEVVEGADDTAHDLDNDSMTLASTQSPDTTQFQNIPAYYLMPWLCLMSRLHSREILTTARTWPIIWYVQLIANLVDIFVHM